MGVIQFEIDRTAIDRSRQRAPADKYLHAQTALERLIRNSWQDTLENGGTMVLVVTDTTITLVQREDAEELEPPAAVQEIANG